MKRIKGILVLMGFLFLCSCSNEQSRNKNLVNYVDPMIGTGAHGHTFPGATTPFGMVQLSPSNDFKNWDWCAGYHYSDSIIKGFAHNHISGAGLSGLGDILLMPTRGKKTTKAGSDEQVNSSYRSRFSHKTEQARAGYYAVTLDDYNINVELTATPRTGFHKYTCNDAGEVDIVIDPTHGVMERASESSIEVVSDTEIRGFKRVTKGKDESRFAYFSAKFSKPFKKAVITNDDVAVNEKKLTAAKAKGYVVFDVEKGATIEVAVTLSGIGYEGVEKNFDAEASGKSFDDVLEETTATWNRVLNKIVISHNTSEEKKRTFYTAMYHAFISPNMISDVDGKYVVEGKQYEFDGSQYSNFSTWDTYRTLHPLFTIIEQEENAKIVNSMISRDTQGVGQPVWELIGYDNYCMIGYTTSSVIGEAVLKDHKGIDYEAAFKSIYNSAFDLTKHSAVYDVSGLLDYINYGYVTGETGSSVSKTTEYNYHDFVIAKVAEKLGKTKEADAFYKRSIGYRGLFNSDNGYLYPVFSNGKMKDLDLTIWDDLIPNYVSGNIWAYSAYTPHDMKGVIQLHGGKEKYAAWLDKVFSDTTEIGGAQHVDISGFIGKYGHGDEPGHQMPYLYNYVGQPYKGQKLVNEVLTTLYSDKPDGLVNNEDLGQMSAWYIFSALGFYPVSPADLTYQLGAPFYESATINLENGSTFTVKAENLTNANFYVQSVKLNGADYNKNYITHDDIMKGGVLEFTMGSTPNTNWGSAEDSSEIGPLPNTAPEIIVKAAGSPFDVNPSFFFSDAHMAILKANGSESVIYYTTDGTVPTKNSKKYLHPIKITENCVLKAIAVTTGLNTSKVYEKPLFKSILPTLKNGYPKITMNNWSDPNYGKADGRMLFDEIVGSSSYGDGKWTGMKENFSVEIDLGSNQAINEVSVGVLTDIDSWIFPASSIKVYGGNTKQNMKPIGEIAIAQSEDFPKEVNRHVIPLKKGNYKYLKVLINSYGLTPEWHEAEGKKAWLFIDEIMIY